MDFKLSVCGYETKHKDKIILYSVTCAIRHLSNIDHLKLFRKYSLPKSAFLFRMYVLQTFVRESKLFRKRISQK
jgi:hypothetical protein